MTTFTLDVQFLATDGINPPLSLGVSYNYDSTQSAAVNIAAIKAAIVAGAAVYGITLTSDNVILLMAVS